MRRSLSISAALFAGIFVAAAAVHAQTIDEVVAKNLKAKGGVEALKSTNTVRMTAKLTATSAPGEMSMTILAKRPNLVRREMSLGGQSMAYGFDGTAAWAQQGGGPPQTITGPQADQLKQTAEFDSVFLNYKEQGHRLELAGNETLDGKPVHHVKVTRKDGTVQHYYLDAGSGLERKLVMDAEQAGVKMKVETELSDYRNVEGRMIPFKMRQFSNGAPAAEITFEKVEFNVPLENALFQPAAK